MTDEQIFEAVRSGGAKCEKACEFMYKTWYQRLAAVVLSQKGTAEQAREIVGETLLRLMKRIKDPHFLLENATLLTYSYTIAKNMASRMAASNDKYRYIDEEFLINKASYDETSAKETLEAVNNALEKLGEPCKSILTYTGLGYSDAEIAVKVGFVEQSVTNRKGKCRKQLINLVGNLSLY